MCKLPLEFHDPPREIIHPNRERDIVLPPGGVSMTFVWCPPGRFMMGSPETENGHYLNESRHEEVIAKGFWIGKFPVTQEQYESLTGENPSAHQAELMLIGSRCPVECITHQMAESFCDLMNRKTDLAGLKAALPSSVQWEYACRAGCSSALNNGTEITFKYGRCWNLEEVAWNPLDKVACPQPVGGKKTNAWGIYDMHGNVWEWCAERYIHISKKGIVSELGEEHIVRGGSFRTYPKYHRSACIFRKYSNKRLLESPDNQAFFLSDVGFRIVLNPVDAETT